MIDFLKISVKDPNVIDCIRNNQNLRYRSSKERLLSDRETLFNSQTFEFKNILFEFSPNQMVILFKPHYYYNNNLHNANDFSVNSCISVMQEFIDRFQIKYFEPFRIVNIEYGVNFIFPKNGKNLISMLAFTSKNEFYRDSDLRYSKKGGSHYRNGSLNVYKILKFYCKGIQYPEFAHEDTLRFEIKSKKSRRIKKMGIHNLGDLLSPKAYDNMKQDLLIELGKILILDRETDLKQLTTREQNKLTSYLSNHKWFEAIQKSRNNFRDMKKRYFLLLDKTGYNVHKDLIEIVSRKLDDLFFGIEKSANSLPIQTIVKSANSRIYKGEVSTRIYQNH